MAEIIWKTQEEIEAEANAPKSPTAEEELRADIDYLAIMAGVDLNV